MGDFLSWYGDLWGDATGGFLWFVALLLAHLLVLALVAAVLAGAGALARRFMKGWRSGAPTDDETAPHP